MYDAATRFQGRLFLSQGGQAPAEEKRRLARLIREELARLLRPKTLRAWNAIGILSDIGPDRYRAREEVYHRLDRIADRGAA